MLYLIINILIFNRVVYSIFIFFEVFLVVLACYFHMNFRLSLLNEKKPKTKYSSFHLHHVKFSCLGRIDLNDVCHIQDYHMIFQLYKSSFLSFTRSLVFFLYILSLFLLLTSCDIMHISIIFLSDHCVYEGCMFQNINFVPRNFIVFFFLYVIAL